MRTVIDHHVYDTATAMLVSLQQGQTLYRKRTGEYFIFIADRIVPLSYEGACEWGQRYMSTDAYINEFSFDPSALNDDVHVSIMMPHALFRKLENESRRTGRSKTAIITDALDAALS